MCIGTSRGGLERGSKQDAKRRRLRAPLSEQPLCDAEVDVLGGRQQPGIGVRVAGPSQRGEAPVEKLAFGQVAPLLLSGRHYHTVRRPAPADAEGSAGPSWTSG